MPTLTRFVLAALLIAAIGYGAIYALANFFQPTQREITVRVSTDRLTRD